MEQQSTPLSPILTVHLFPKIEEMLLELLESLSEEDWQRQTIAPKWRVKDVAAHLLDTQLRKLSLVRDCYAPNMGEIDSSQKLIDLINRLNEEGVRIYSRLSPRMLIALMRLASRESAEFHQSLDPYALSSFSVSWAGEQASLNWFDTAREFTERWHHQQQIRLAVSKEGIMIPELYHPVLDCFMRALPYHYREVTADTGIRLDFKISGDCGGTWILLRDQSSWQLTSQDIGKPACLVTIPQEIAWRIFTKGISRSSAESQVQIDGDRKLGEHILDMITIVG